MKRCRNGHDVLDKSNQCFACGVTVPYIRESQCRNGHPNPDNHKWCGICEARIPILVSSEYVTRDVDTGKPSPGESVSLQRARYLGGIPEYPAEVSGELVIKQVGMSISTQEIVQFCECKGVVVEGGQVAKRRIGAALAFGVLGALAAKGSKNQSVITAQRNDGAHAFFELDKLSEQQVKARISPVLLLAGVPLVDDFDVFTRVSHLAAVPSTSELADRIRELAQLRSEGLITSEQFELKRDEILSRM